MFFIFFSGGVICCYMCYKIKKVNKINTFRAFLGVTKLLQAVTKHKKVNKINKFYCYKEKLRTEKWGVMCIFKKYTYPIF